MQNVKHIVHVYRDNPDSHFLTTENMQWVELAIVHNVNSPLVFIYFCLCYLFALPLLLFALSCLCVQMSLL